MSFVLRVACLDDLDGLVAVEAASKAEIDREYFRGELNNPLSRCYLAQDSVSQKICAYLIVWQLDEGDFELHHLATLPQFRRLGLARRLFDHLLQAHADSLKRIFLEVRAGNLGAIAFYQSLGFTRIGQRRQYYRRPDEDAYLYQYCNSIVR